MAWRCEACTFINSSSSLQRCEICHTERAPSNAEASTTDERASNKTVQSTLFGAIAPRVKKTKSKKREKPTGFKPDAPLSKHFRPMISAKTEATYRTLKENAKKALKDVFGIEKLRNLQPIAIKCALKRKSQIVVMATGGGKSLCYQLPAVAMGGLSIVVSPLIALMADQVQALISKGIEAAVISSTNGERHNLDILERVLGRSLRRQRQKKPSGSLKPITLLYCTPEQIQTQRFRHILAELDQKNGLSLFAIDEAHCLSSWGHDFRPAFRKLNWVRDSFPKIPCMACTATATPKVIDDIKQILRLENAPCHKGSFNRHNLFYKVRFKDTLDDMCPGGAMADLIQFIQKRHAHCNSKSIPCSGIIYVHSRKDTEDLARAIRHRTGIPIAGYHGGLKAAERSQVQEDWTSSKTPIVVATIAFGMGIDLAHVRYVVHWTLAKTVEGFYQESGRAGRDGLPSHSLLYYSRQDTSRFQYLIKQRKPKDEKDKSVVRALEALKKMNKYATSATCRRCYLLDHFGETADPKSVCSKTCDYCLDPSKVQKAIEAALAPSFKTGLSSRVYTGSRAEEPKQDVDWTVDSLNINHDTPFEGGDIDEDGAKPSAASFVKASSILDKYEVRLAGEREKGCKESTMVSNTLSFSDPKAIECERGQPNGFVRFRPKSKVSGTPPVPLVPKHLLSNMPDPLGHLEKKQSAVEQKTSADYSAEADQLRAQIAKSQAEREAKMQALLSKKARAPPPPPPAVSFRKK